MSQTPNPLPPAEPALSMERERSVAALLGKIFHSGARQKLLAFASLIVLIAFFGIASPQFLQVDNLVSIL